MKDGTDVPDDIQYATSVNMERDSINTAVFEKHCIESAAQNGGIAVDSILLFSDQITVHKGDKEKIPFRNRPFFWETCGESQAKVTGKTSERVDPVLKLWYNCEVMLTKNDDVKASIANGTRAKVVKVVLKQGESTFPVKISGATVPGIFASSVSHVVLEHVNKDAKPGSFVMKPKRFTINAGLPNSLLSLSSTDYRKRYTLRMHINQLPVISNSATTGHKLQGTSLDKLFVSEWKQEASWIYVILSRVRTRDGLYLRQPLDQNMSCTKCMGELQTEYTISVLAALSQP